MEQRRIRISRKALLAYMLNLSTRQFQENYFILPMYDMVTREQVSRSNFIRAKIPCCRRNSDGSFSTKAEAFGNISLKDMEQACAHRIACSKNARRGAVQPKGPVSVDGVPGEFFTDIVTLV